MEALKLLLWTLWGVVAGHLLAKHLPRWPEPIRFVVAMLIIFLVLILQRVISHGH